jgi:putative ABC transport system permease protein
VTLHYLQTAFAQLLHRPWVNAINLLSLAIGLATALILGLYLHFHATFESYNPLAAQVYRISLDVKRGDNDEMHLAFSFPQTSHILNQRFGGEIEQTSRLLIHKDTLQIGQKSFNERIYFTDNTALNLFALNIVQGSGFNQPENVLLSESIAQKYFGRSNPIGQQLLLGGEFMVTVAGVFENLPGNTHLKLDVLLDERFMATVKGADSYTKMDGSVVAHTYFKLKQGGDINSIKKGFTVSYCQLFPCEAKQDSGKHSFSITSIQAIHTGGTHIMEMQPPTPKRYLVGAGVAVLVLLLVCAFNYSLMITVLAQARVKEVMLRKTMGASGYEILLQFLTEAGLNLLIALTLAIGLLEWCLPLFNQYTSLQLSLVGVFNWSFGLTLLVALLLMLMVAVAYPALLLANLRPALTIRFGQGKALLWLSRILLGIEFFLVSISLLFVFGIQSQMHYLDNVDRGFASDQLLVLYKLPTSTLAEQGGSNSNAFTRLKNAVKDLDIDITASEQAPPYSAFRSLGVQLPQDKSQTQTFGYKPVQFGYFKTLNLKLLAGRAFSPQYGQDVLTKSDHDFSIVMNKAAAQQLGWFDPEQAIGQLLKVNNHYSDFNVSVIGVIDNYYSQGLDQPIVAEFYLLEPEPATTVLIKVPKGQMANVQKQLGVIWKRLFNEQKVEFYQVEQMIQSEYRQHRLLMGITLLAGVIMLILSFCGLGCLQLYLLHCRRKELAIRQVMGATFTDTVKLLGLEFVRLLMFSALLAIPASYWLLENWLSGYPLRVDNAALWYVLSPTILLVITMAIVTLICYFYQLKRPLNALRYG